MLIVLLAVGAAMMTAAAPWVPWWLMSDLLGGPPAAIPAPVRVRTR